MKKTPNGWAVASLGWVSPVAATDGVTPIFFGKKLATFLCSSLSLLLISLGCHPLWGCHPAPFLPVLPRVSSILCKFVHNFFILRVSPTWKVSPGAVRPPVTPRAVEALIIALIKLKRPSMILPGDSAANFWYHTGYSFRCTWYRFSAHFYFVAEKLHGREATQWRQGWYHLGRQLTVSPLFFSWKKTDDLF